ncbi:hypothetical protein KCP78_22235 [Salmonella enterica subsp. enterica]|nr:hypothetical protein KCP78_22235 [Salmonella enterica subsp. enterica]
MLAQESDKPLPEEAAQARCWLNAGGIIRCRYYLAGSDGSGLSTRCCWHRHKPVRRATR